MDSQVTSLVTLGGEGQGTPPPPPSVVKGEGVGIPRVIFGTGGHFHNLIRGGVFIAHDGDMGLSHNAIDRSHLTVISEYHLVVTFEKFPEAILENNMRLAVVIAITE